MGKGYDTLVTLLTIVLAAFAVEMIRPGLVVGLFRQLARLIGLL